MTVNNTNSKITYAGNGSTTSWAFLFPGVEPENIHVFLTDPDGIISQPAANLYSVLLNFPVDPNPTSHGGLVTYPLTGPPLPAGWHISIVRILEPIQDTALSNQSIIYPPVVEQELDYLTLLDQQVQEEIDRAVKVGIADQPMADLPPLELRRNQQAVFDSNGNLVAGGIVLGTVISPAMVPVVTATTLPLARTAMGVAGIDSPVFTGDPQAPTKAIGDNDTSLATTAFVQNQIGSSTGAFPSGTVMLFGQTAAPTGWTKLTSHHDKALRLVNSTAGSGGSFPFSSVFAQTTTQGFTLTINEMPVHNHGVSDPGHGHPVSPNSTPGSGSVFLSNFPGGTELSPLAGGQPYNLEGATAANAFTGIGIFNNGAGQAHLHGMDIRVQYVDVIMASRN